MKKHSISLTFLVRCSMLTALTAVLTLFPRIPLGNGYAHMGDCIIYLTGAFLGPLPAAICGGIGQCLADIIGGYPIYAVPTLLIKGLLGLLVGKLIYRHETHVIRLLSAAILAHVIVASGYFLVDFFLYGLEVALITLLSPTQWIMSILATTLLLPIAKQVLRKP